MKKTKEEILKKAIEEIIDPIGKMKSILEEGEQLNGLYANSLYNSANYLREIAVKALKEYEHSDQEKQGWVKITSPETMPPYFEHIIVFGGEVHCRLFSKAWVALQPEEFVERTGISHWMPLPEPPKQ